MLQYFWAKYQIEIEILISSHH